MKSVKFLHISDLHRGVTWNNEPCGNHKDKSVTSEFAGAIISPMESDFIDSIKRWQNNHGDIDSIVCTGDLGNQGEADKIEEGAYFINNIMKELGIGPDNVLICPGNHDADRKQDSDHLFSGYSQALAKYSFKDYSQNTSPVYVNNIPFVVVNTCLGAGEKSIFINKYNQLVEGLTKGEKDRFETELKEAGAQHIEIESDVLDIPAVTNPQRKRILNVISKADSSFVVLVMHHNLIPCNMVEIRPYSFTIDAGKTIDQLIESEKDVLILHGHVHFPSSYILQRPDSNFFISSVGAGLFNGYSGSSVNIVELFCSDDGKHIITIVYEYIKQVNGFQFDKHFCICNKRGNDVLSDVLSYFNGKQEMGFEFGEIINTIKCKDKDLLYTLMSNDTIFRISRNKSSDPYKWIIYKN